MGTSFSSTSAGHHAPIEENTDDEEERSSATIPTSTTQHEHGNKRKRKQTDFLSPKFTPQKRNRDGTNTTSARGSSSKGSSSSTSPKVVFVKYEKQWENNLNLLLQYKQVHGNCKVPPSYRVTTSNDGNNNNNDDGTIVALGKWLENQKQFYKRDKLSDERYDKLNKLGVEFGKKKSIKEEDSDTTDDDENTTTDNNNTSSSGFFGTLFSPKKSPSKSSPKQTTSESKSSSPPKSSSPKVKLSWEEYRQQLISYKNQHNGNCNIPSSDRDNKQLSKWCENQRMFHRQNKLSRERIALLTDIGFEFTASKEERFERHFRDLVEYKSEFGNCNVPQKHPTLGRWVNKIRSKYNDKTLSRKQYDKLKSVGFCWDGSSMT